MEKNYCVVRLYEHCSPSAIEFFKNLDDARIMAEVLNRKGEYRHIVMEEMEEGK